MAKSTGAKCKCCQPESKVPEVPKEPVDKNNKPKGNYLGEDEMPEGDAMSLKEQMEDEMQVDEPEPSTPSPARKSKSSELSQFKSDSDNALGEKTLMPAKKKANNTDSFQESMVAAKEQLIAPGDPTSGTVSTATGRPCMLLLD